MSVFSGAVQIPDAFFRLVPHTVPLPVLIWYNGIGGTRRTHGILIVSVWADKPAADGGRTVFQNRHCRGAAMVYRGGGGGDGLPYRGGVVF